MSLVEAEPLFVIMRHCHDLRRVEQDGQAVWLGDPMEVALLEGTPPDGAVFSRVWTRFRSTPSASACR